MRDNRALAAKNVISGELAEPRRSPKVQQKNDIRKRARVFARFFAIIVHSGHIFVAVFYLRCRRITASSALPRNYPPLCSVCCLRRILSGMWTRGVTPAECSVCCLRRILSSMWYHLWLLGEFRLLNRNFIPVTSSIVQYVMPL